MVGRRQSWRASLSLATVALASCLEPTQITLQLTTDLDCAAVASTSITAGAPGEELESRAPATLATTCVDGRLGSIVAVPSGDDAAAVAFRIVTGVDADADCSIVGNPSCIVARRALRYLPSTPLELPIVMRGVCLGEYCDVSTTCVGGVCVPADVDPERCAAPGGCGEDVLVGDGGGAGGGGGGGGGGAPSAAPWSRRYGSSDMDVAYSVAVDPVGNVYATGYFEGTVDFGGGPLVSAGGSDVFLVSVAPDGGFRWGKRFGGAALDEGWGVAVDSAGNVYATGTFFGPVDFGGGPLASAGSGDVFVASFTPDGSHRWSKRFGSTGMDHGWALDVHEGHLYVAGLVNGAVDFGGGALASETGDEDGFLLHLDLEGNHVWSKRFGGAGLDCGVALDGSAAGVCVGGYFSGSADLGKQPLESMGGVDGFVACYGHGGELRWSRGFGGTLGDVARAIAHDAAGDVYVTGSFAEKIDLGGGALTSAGQNDVFVARYDGVDGTHRWSRAFGGAGMDSGFAISLGPDGHLLLTGDLSAVADFGGEKLTSAGGNDVVVASYSSDGAHRWSRRFGGAGLDRGTSIAHAPNGDLYVAGLFAGTVDFGTGSLTSAGKADAFVARILSPP